MPEMATDRVTETGSNPFDHHHYDYSPWSFWRTASHSQRQHQLDLQAQACARQPEWSLGEECFLSELATVQADVLVLGERCYLAAGSYLTGEIRAGRDCTVNAFTVVRGQVELGDGVRIGAHTSILAFNHTMSDPDVEVFRQPTTSRGVSIGDDVWIGSHVVVVDGVTVGSKAMLAAGAVVTKDVPGGAVVGGNPARVLRWRVPPPGAASGSDDLGSRVVAWADRAREQIPDVLARSWAPELPGGQFLDQPGHRPSVRAQCDAIEIADLWLGRAPDQLPEVEQQNRLRGWQDPVTGLVPELDQTATPRAAPVDWHDRDAAYHVLCVGYALDLLGSSFPKPISAVSDRTAPELVQALDALPWRNRAWGAGAWVDMVGTALRWNLSHGEVGQTGWAEALFGWLQIHTDPHTGMWGSPRTEDGMLQVVNGCYRASRGTLAQFGMPFARPERVIDTVLVHSTEARLFAASRQNACNVLDVAHPLWLALKQTDYRSQDVEVLARRLLGEAIGHWTDGAGFGFQAPHSTTRAVAATTPGLQGTEMWSATIWLLADLCGLGSVLGYRPRGIHRPEPALHLSHRSS